MEKTGPEGAPALFPVYTSPASETAHTAATSPQRIDILEEAGSFSALSTDPGLMLYAVIPFPPKKPWEPKSPRATSTHESPRPAPAAEPRPSSPEAPRPEPRPPESTAEETKASAEARASASHTSASSKERKEEAETRARASHARTEALIARLETLNSDSWTLMHTQIPVEKAQGYLKWALILGLENLAIKTLSLGANLSQALEAVSKIPLKSEHYKPLVENYKALKSLSETPSPEVSAENLKKVFEALKAVLNIYYLKPIAWEPLVRACLKLNQKNLALQGLLVTATWVADEALVQNLLDAGLEPCLQNAEGNSPWHYFANFKTKSPESVKKIEAAGTLVLNKVNAVAKNSINLLDALRNHQVLPQTRVLYGHTLAYYFSHHENRSGLDQLLSLVQNQREQLALKPIISLTKNKRKAPGFIRGDISFP
ncbi:MAG: hypothetical protein ACKOAD_01620 [Gammaproteobacteria bacterium]